MFEFNNDMLTYLFLSLSDIECPYPPNITNGYYKETLVILGSKVSYACEEGFTLTESDKAQCDKNGEWTNNVPSCSRKSMNCNFNLV